jgi:GTP-binding protein HflX
VGYTNAGKSSLFNRLTAAGVYAQDQLFATLDPTLRRVELQDESSLILADTVGFVSRLPHELVAAFRSTLQETVEADLLIHVIDAHSHQRAEQVAEVEDVLAQIGAEGVPRIEVYNKIDLMPEAQPRVEYNEQGEAVRVWLSAATGSGVEGLIEALTQRFRSDIVNGHVLLGPADGRLRALLFEQGAILSENHLKDGGSELEVQLKRRDYERLKKHEPQLAQQWQESLEDVPEVG